MIIITKKGFYYNYHQPYQDVWITWVGERLDELIDKGLTIPIMKDVDKLRDEFFEKLEKNKKKQPVK